MLFIIKFAPEIITKSKPVRKHMCNKLKRNLISLFHAEKHKVAVDLQWDKILLTVEGDEIKDKPRAIDILKRTPGIAHFLDVSTHTFESYDQAAALCLTLFKDTLKGKTFVVRCKRSGKHEFTSHEFERQIGGRLLAGTEGSRVSLKSPEVTVHMELANETLYIIDKKIKGLGGFPTGEVDPVLSLISGGFDSSVSSYMTMRRGMPTHFCFFNLGGKEHEIAVKEVAYYLWEHFGSGINVKFFSVPFEAVVTEILTTIDNSHMGVVLKRMMMRAASTLAEQYNIHALVTGEAVAQVSSQTVINLNMIDRVTNTLILRPLITTDKEDIIAIARDIGTEPFSAVIPEYCGVISKKPTTRAKLYRIEREETNFNFDVLDRAVAQTATSNLYNLAEKESTGPDIIVTSTPNTHATILDIRHPNDVLDKPFSLEGFEVEQIPFYSLNNAFDSKDKSKEYLLYCDKGVMSKLHASHLREKGLKVGVYKTPKQ